MEYPFVAVFCPSCGACVNEPEEELTGSRLVTCGWCKQRHSMEGVVVCRNLSHLTEQQRMDGALMATKLGLLALRERLRTPVALVDAIFGATVWDAGGGWVHMAVDRNTYSYPPVGARVIVLVQQ